LQNLYLNLYQWQNWGLGENWGPPPPPQPVTAPGPKIRKGDMKQLETIAPTLLCNYKPCRIRALCGENKCSVRLLVFCLCSSWKVKNVHLLFAELLRHKPTLHDFVIVVFLSKKPGCTARRYISAEPISDWSDPGQLTFVSYPVYVSSVPGSTHAVVTTAIRLRCDGRSTTYRRSLRSQ